MEGYLYTIGAGALIYTISKNRISRYISDTHNMSPETYRALLEFRIENYKQDIEKRSEAGPIQPEKDSPVFTLLFRSLLP